MKNIVEKVLYRAGISSNFKGYYYLAKAVEIAACDYEIINALTKELYPEVGELFNVTGYGVERGIRTAIKMSNLKKDIWICDFRKPTNKELISTLAAYVRLEIDKAERGD